MGSKRKPKVYRPKSWESCPPLAGRTYDTSANIYHSMMLSPAWKDLTHSQRVLYLVCKDQFYSVPTAKHPITNADGEPHETRNYFYLNRYIWQTKYGLYKEGNERQFYKDLEQLVLHGFIGCIISGKATKRKSVYCYLDLWRKWGTPEWRHKPIFWTPAMREKYKDLCKEE